MKFHIIHLFQKFFSTRKHLKNKINSTDIQVDLSNFILVKHKNDKRDYAISKNEAKKFKTANSDELFTCTPLSKNGQLNSLKSFFFAKDELHLS